MKTLKLAGDGHDTRSIQDYAGLTLHHRAVHATLLSLAGHHRTIHHHSGLGKSSRSTADFPTAGWNASAQQPARDFGPDLG